MQHIFEARDLLAQHRAQFFTENSLKAIADLTVNHTVLTEAIADLLQQKDPQHHALLATLLSDFSLYCRVAGSVDDAIQKLKLASDYFQEACASKELCLMKTELGHLHFASNNFQLSELYYTEALAEAEIQGMDHHKTSILLRLGDVQRLQGRVGLALDYYREAQAIARDELSQADAKECLGKLSRLQKESLPALSHYAQALEQYKEIKAVLGQVNCHNGLGDVYFSLPDHGLARTHYSQALALATSINEPQGIANAQLGLIRLELSGNGFDESILQKINAVQHSYRSRHEWLGVGNTHFVLGTYYALQSNPDYARRAYYLACDMFERVNASLNFQITHQQITEISEDSPHKSSYLTCLDKKGAVQHA